MELKKLKQHIRTLASLEESEALVISCYLNLEGGIGGFRETFNKRVGMLQRAIRQEHRQPFVASLQRIDACIQKELDPKARGVAVFARDGNQPFFLPLQFRVPLPTWVAADATPNIYHLVELKDTYHRYVVMLCAAERMRILEINLGSVTAQVWKDRPELRKRVGREWTKRHYQNHRRERTNRFVTEMTEILNQRMSAGGYEHLILTGSPRITARVRDALPKHLADKVVDSLVASQHDPVPDVVEATLSSFIEVERRESLSMVELLLQEVQRDGLAVAGRQASLAALKKGQVDVLVLAKEHDCDAREEMAQLAEQAGCRIETVEQSNPLMLLGGVGCLLRYRTRGFDAPSSEGPICEARSA